MKRQKSSHRIVSGNALVAALLVGVIGTAMSVRVGADIVWKNGAIRRPNAILQAATTVTPGTTMLPPFMQQTSSSTSSVKNPLFSTRCLVFPNGAKFCPQVLGPVSGGIPSMIVAAPTFAPSSVAKSSSSVPMPPWMVFLQQQKSSSVSSVSSPTFVFSSSSSIAAIPQIPIVTIPNPAMPWLPLPLPLPPVYMASSSSVSSVFSSIPMISSSSSAKFVISSMPFVSSSSSSVKNGGPIFISTSTSSSSSSSSWLVISSSSSSRSSSSSVWLPPVTTVTNVSSSAMGFVTRSCDDLIDNDNDGDADEDDRGCQNGGRSEYYDTYRAMHGAAGDPTCFDNSDNNGNRIVDFDDPNCRLGRMENGAQSPVMFNASSAATFH